MFASSYLSATGGHAFDASAVQRGTKSSAYRSSSVAISLALRAMARLIHGNEAFAAQVG
jgi:hypothetical protein